MAGTVEVVSSTWARDSHDLFDFEASQLQRQSFSIPRTALFYRTGSEVRAVASGEAVPSGGDPLLKLVMRDSHFVVDAPGTANGARRRLWLVVRDLPSCGHRLAEGDIIKLGRFKFRARQIVASACGGQQPLLDFDDGTSCCNAPQESPPDLSQTLCRICLLEGPGEDDPLITPCHCKGSIEFVHLGCLRHWIRGRLNLADAPGGSYFFRPLACELCKGTYPTHIHNGKERQALVEVPHTQPPFIVLENVVRDSQQMTARGLHVISLAEKVLKLGRGHESDIRIPDVSISRFHAKIRFHSGFFLLEDNDSKFGTLVAMKKPRVLEPGSPVSIQMGRTVLSLTATMPGEYANHGILLHQGSTHDERWPRLPGDTDDTMSELPTQGC